MENRDLDFLSEMKKALASLKEQLEELENRVEEYQQSLDSKEVEAEPIDLDIDDGQTGTEPEPEFVAEPEAEMEPEPEPEANPEPEEEPAPEEEPTAEEEPTTEEEPTAEKETVMDAMMHKHPWRTDMPGLPVKDIRSAISLNDRILFINTLFDEEPMMFQQTITALNAMTTLDQAVDLLTEKFPGWNFDSDTVYRFMMAVRRHVR